MARFTGASVRFVMPTDLERLIGWQSLRGSLGLDSDSRAQETAVGVEWLFVFDFSGTGSSRQVTATLINQVNLATVRRESQRLSANDKLHSAEVTSFAQRMARNLDCDLRQYRTKPVSPVLTLALSPTTVAPGGTVKAAVRLTDLASNNEPQPFMEIELRHVAPDRNLETTYVLTKVDGNAEGELTAGGTPNGEGRVAALIKAENS